MNAQDRRTRDLRSVPPSLSVWSALAITRQGQLVTARPAPMLDVAKLIITRKVGCVPVLDARDRPIGILTQKDVLAALVDQLAARQPT